MIHRLVLTLWLGLSTSALAQDEQPAIPTAPEAEARTIPSGSLPAVDGQQEESPIGLYIMLWRNAAADQDADRPARLLRELLLPVDEAVFVRRVSYHHSLSRALAERQQVTPEP